MTSHDDGPLAAQFAALAPEPLEDRWDDVLREATTARGDGRRVERSAVSHGRRRYLVAFVAAVLVAAIGTAAYGTLRLLILDQGFIGVPPVGATPSSPESGELVLRWDGFTGSHAAGTHAIRRVWVYADGRFIWDRREHDADLPGGVPEGANEFNSGYLEQRLTSDGVELVRAAAAELVDRSRALVDEIPAQTDPWLVGNDRLTLVLPKDFGSAWGDLVVPDGDRWARLRWGAADEVYPAPEGTNATPEQLSSLRRVYALLADDPASVLPSNAWAAQKTRAYVPSHYAVCVHTPPKEVSQILAMLPTQAADLLRDKTLTHSEGPGPSRDCFRVDTEDARKVAGALSGLDREPEWDGLALAYRVADAIDYQDRTWIWFEPYFPDGQITFSGPFG